MKRWWLFDGISMKKLLAIMLMANLLFPTPPKSSVIPPDWYLAIEETPPSIYIGYGQGKSYEEAKQKGLKDIILQIETTISATSNTRTSRTNDSYHNSFDTDITQQSTMTISDYERVLSAKRGDTYYVKLRYDNRPAIQRFGDAIKKRYGSPKAPTKRVKKSHYLSQTALQKALDLELGAPTPFELFRKDRAWYIKHRNISQRLGKRDFGRLFATIKHPDIKASLSNGKKYLRDKERFFFNITTQKSGMVSILSVYEDGTVSVLMENIPMTANEKTAIPDEEFEKIFEAGLLEEGKDSFELFVFIFGTGEMSFDAFALADENIINDESYKNFDELTRFLVGKSFATLKITTRP